MKIAFKPIKFLTKQPIVFVLSINALSAFAAPYYDEVYVKTNKLRDPYKAMNRRLKTDVIHPSQKAVEKLTQNPLGDKIKIHPIPLALDRYEYREIIQYGAAQRARALALFFEDIVLGKQRAFQRKNFVSRELVDEILFESRYGGLENLRKIWKGRTADSINFTYGPDLMRNEQGEWRVIEDNVGPIGGLSDTPAILSFYKTIHRRFRSPQKTLPDLLRMFTSAGEFWRDRREKRVGLGFIKNSGEVNPKVEPKKSDLEYVREAQDISEFGYAILFDDFLSDIPAEAGKEERVEIADSNKERVKTFDELVRFIVNFHEIATQSDATAALALSRFAKGKIEFLNAPGTSDLLDHKAMLPFVDEMVRFYLHEEPIIKTQSTYLLGSRFFAHFDEAKLKEMVIKKGDGSQGSEVFIMPRYKAGARDQMLEKLMMKAESSLYVAQEYMESSKVFDHYIDVRPHVLMTKGRLAFVSKQIWGRAADANTTTHGKTNVSQGASELVVWTDQCENLLEGSVRPSAQIKTKKFSFRKSK